MKDEIKDKLTEIVDCASKISKYVQFIKMHEHNSLSFEGRTENMDRALILMKKTVEKVKELCLKEGEIAFEVSGHIPDGQYLTLQNMLKQHYDMTEKMVNNQLIEINK